MRFYITIPAHRTDDGRDVSTWFYVAGSNSNFSPEFPDAQLFKTRGKAYSKLLLIRESLTRPVGDAAIESAMAKVASRLTIVEEEA